MKLVIDLGQSGVRFKTDNQLTSRPIAKSTNDSTLEALETIFRVIPEEEYENVFLSLTGVNGVVKNHEAIAELCRRYFKSKNVAVMDDGFAAYFGALGRRTGVVLTIGSGVVAVSGNEGKYAHTDGKGSIFGDSGSGFWLGQSALRRAVATLDSRDSAHDLVALLKEELAQLQSMSNQVGPEATLLCIKAAKTVTQGAERGVDAAVQILETGAEHLAATITSAWSKVKNSNNERPLVLNL